MNLTPDNALLGMDLNVITQHDARIFLRYDGEKIIDQEIILHHELRQNVTVNAPMYDSFLEENNGTTNNLVAMTKFIISMQE